MKTFDVFGIGHPLVDLLALVPDQFLEAQGLVKNRMYLVDFERQQKILSELEKNNTAVLYMPGGSCANSMIGIAQLGGAADFLVGKSPGMNSERFTRPNWPKRRWFHPWKKAKDRQGAVSSW